MMVSSPKSATKRTCHCRYQGSTSNTNTNTNTISHNRNRHNTQRKMQRRGAVICTTQLRPSRHLVTCPRHHDSESESEPSPKTVTSHSNSRSHSHSPERRRRKRSGYKRRFALCGNHALDPRVLKKVAEIVRSERIEHSHSHSSESESSEVSSESCRMMRRRISRATAKPTEVLFCIGSSSNGSATTSTSRHSGNVQFQSIIHSYYFDMYQFTMTATHRSIVRSAVLDDLKSRGFTFYQERTRRGSGSQTLVNNHNNEDDDHDYDTDDDELFCVMDDMDALQKIRGAFHALTRKRRSSRRSSASSAGKETDRPEPSRA